MNNLEPFVIISAEKAELGPADNAARSANLAAYLRHRRVAMTLVNGAYKGHRESGFLVLLPDGDSGPVYSDIIRAARVLDQDAVLYVDSRREAYLDDARGQQVRIGSWREVTTDGPLPESYTEKGGRYYAAL